MTAVKVEIVRFVDEHQPGFVEVALVDAAGRLHTFVEKVPVAESAEGEASFVVANSQIIG
jgi:hypothetical protein